MEEKKKQTHKTITNPEEIVLLARAAAKNLTLTHTTTHTQDEPPPPSLIAAEMRMILLIAGPVDPKHLPDENTLERIATEAIQATPWPEPSKQSDEIPQWSEAEQRATFGCVVGDIWRVEAFFLEAPETYQTMGSKRESQTDAYTQVMEYLMHPNIQRIRVLKNGRLHQSINISKKEATP